MQADLFYQLVRSLREVVWITSPDGTALTYASPSTEELFGRSRKSFHENPRIFLEAVHPEDRGRLTQALDAERESGFARPHEEQYRIVRPDGTLRWVWSRYVGLRDGRGALLLGAVATDVTERKRLENALLESEARYRQLVELSPEGIVMHHGEKILFANSAAAKIVGAPDPEQLIGRDVMGFIHPDSKALVEERAQELRAGRAAPLVEARFIRLDGRGIDVEVASTPFTHRDQPAVLVAFRDVTERKRSEDALRQSEAMFRGLVEMAAEAIVIADERGVIQLFNPAAERLFGFTAEEAVGQNVKILMPSPLREEHDRSLERYLKTGERRVIGIGREVQGQRKDGTLFPLNIALSEVRLGDRRGFTALLSDLTERRREEDRLRMQFAVTRVLAESVTFSNAAPRILEAICQALGWDFGALWLVDPSAGLLRCAYSWHAPSAGLEEFAAETQGLTFGRGVGMPGRAWSAGSAVWVREIGRDPTFLRQAAAGRHGLRSACAFPVGVGTGVLGMLDFVMRRIGDESPELSNILTDIGSQVGQFLQRAGAEETIRLLSSVVEQTADSVIITDTEGAIQYVNSAFAAMTGYSWEEALGHTPRILKSGTHPQEYYEGLWRTIRSGQVHRGVTVNRKKSGELYDEEKTITPIKDAAENVTHFLSTGRDITSRIKAEEEQRRLQAAVERAAAEWRLTFDAIEAPILVLDAQGRIVRMNRAAQVLSGRDDEPCLPCALTEFGSGEPWRSVAQVVDRVRATRSTGYDQAREEGGGRTWEITAVCWGAGAGDERVVVFAQNVTRVMELQESLRRSETMSAMGSLLAGVAHEVRNPLFGISSTLDAIEARFTASEDLGRFVAVLKQEANRLSALMQELLEYGRPPSRELFGGPIEPVIAEAVESCGGLAGRSQVEIVNTVTDGLGEVAMDRRRLTEVFRNVVENALQHSPPRAAVTLKARKVAEAGRSWLECVVEDCGPGFQPDDLPHVFDPFFTHRRGGTGLGLSIAQRIVEEHGGRVVASNRPHGGAAVTVMLPLLEG